MVNKFDNNEIKFLENLLNSVSNNDDRAILSVIIDKMISQSTAYEDKKKLATERILEKRKEDAGKDI